MPGQTTGGASVDPQTFDRKDSEIIIDEKSQFWSGFCVVGLSRVVWEAPSGNKTRQTNWDRERESFLSTDGAPEGGEDNKLAEREAEDKEGPHVDQLEPARIPMNEAWISIVHVNLQKALWKLLSPVVWAAGGSGYMLTLCTLHANTLHATC